MKAPSQPPRGEENNHPDGSLPLGGVGGGLFHFSLLVFELSPNELTVESSDVGDGFALRTHCLASTSVGAVGAVGSPSFAASQMAGHQSHRYCHYEQAEPVVFLSFHTCSCV